MSRDPESIYLGITTSLGSNIGETGQLLNQCRQDWKCEADDGRSASLPSRATIELHGSKTRPNNSFNKYNVDKSKYENAAIICVPNAVPSIILSASNTIVRLLTVGQCNDSTTITCFAVASRAVSIALAHNDNDSFGGRCIVYGGIFDLRTGS